MSVTIETERGCMVTVAVGPAPNLVRLEVFGPLIGRQYGLSDGVAVNLTPREALLLVKDILARVRP